MHSKTEIGPETNVNIVWQLYFNLKKKKITSLKKEQQILYADHYHWHDLQQF